MRALLVAGFAVAIASAGSAASAQLGTIAGTVARDTLGGVIGNAEVSLPALNRTSLTNPRGEFELSDVPMGRYAITVRAIGYQMLVDTIDVTDGGRIDADIVLTRNPVDLAPVKTTERATEQRLPAGIAEMEERRKMHMGGYFVTDSTLRANDASELTSVITSLPEIHQVLGPMGKVYLANARGNPVNPRIPCYIDIYLDGAVYYRSGQGEPPDFNSLSASGFSGIEYYASGATTPPEYNGTRTLDCGTILLWTRRTP